MKKANLNKYNSNNHEYGSHFSYKQLYERLSHILASRTTQKIKETKYEKYKNKFETQKLNQPTNKTIDYVNKPLLELPTIENKMTRNKHIAMQNLAPYKSLGNSIVKRIVINKKDNYKSNSNINVEVINRMRFISYIK